MPSIQAVNQPPPLSTWQAAVGVMRLPFLSLALISVMLGVAVAWYQSADLEFVRVGAVLLAALCAHAAVNALNEYEDFKSGLDLNTQRTPFSGGSGTLPDAPQHATLARNIGISLSFVTIVIGVWLAATSGLYLWGLGILGMLLVWTYTGPLNRLPLLCLAAPGLGFGLCIVVGTEYALTGTFSITGAIAGTLTALLASGLLLLNQFPDRDADAKAGRKHLIIRYGYTAGTIVFVTMLVLVFLILGESVVLSLLPTEALLAMLPVLLIPRMLPAIIHFEGDSTTLTPALGQNVLLVNLVPLLLAIGLALGG